jgi:hypothetical protein
LAQSRLSLLLALEVAPERLCFPDQPPMVATGDMQHTRAFRNLLCSSLKSAAAFIEFAIIEAAEILAAHKSSVQAIADALVKHGTLDAEQIDHCIATAEAEDCREGAAKAMGRYYRERRVVQSNLHFGRRQKRIDAITSLERETSFCRRRS